MAAKLPVESTSVDPSSRDGPPFQPPLQSQVNQGSVLGPLLFLVHFRGIMEAMGPSQTSLFAINTTAFEENCSGGQSPPCCGLAIGKHLGSLSCWAASNNVDFITAKSADLVVGWKPPPSVSFCLNGTTLSRVQGHVHVPWHYNNIGFALERPCCHCSEKSRTCTELDSNPCLSPSATSRSYPKVLRCIYSTACGVSQCSVVWRVSRVSKVARKNAAECC